MSEGLTREYTIAVSHIFSRYRINHEVVIEFGLQYMLKLIDNLVLLSINLTNNDRYNYDF